MLTKADSNIGIPDIDGKTPLHWAASSKDSQAVDCVQLILVSAQHEIYEKFAKCTHVTNIVVNCLFTRVQYTVLIQKTFTSVLLCLPRKHLCFVLIVYST